MFGCNGQSDRYEEIVTYAFTNPFDSDSIEIYDYSERYLRSIPPDEEGGWIVGVREFENDYFVVDIMDLGIKNMKLKKGSLGLVLQNVGLEDIAVYGGPSADQDTLFVYRGQSQIVLLEDYINGFFKVSFVGEQKGVWIHRKHLCSNPYTTCP
jgi:hypothetical protein